jgi:hypothetical protein
MHNIRHDCQELLAFALPPSNDGTWCWPRAHARAHTHAQDAEDQAQQARVYAAAEAKAARTHVDQLRAQHQADLEAERDKLESR